MTKQGNAERKSKQRTAMTIVERDALYTALREKRAAETDEERIIPIQYCKMLPRPSTSPKSPNNPSNQVPSCNGILATFWSHLPLPLRAILITIFITIVIQILIANFSAFLDQKFETFEMKFQNDISQIQNSNSKLEAKSSSFLDKIFGTFEKKFQNDTSQIQNSISKLDEKLKNISQSQMENGKFAIL